MEQQNQQTPPQEQPSPSSSKNFLTNPKLPVIAAAAFIILAGAGILLLTNVSVSNQVTHTPPPSPQPQATDTDDFTLSEVEGWQTYRNEEFGFEVQHPPQGFGVKVITGESSLETYLQEFNESRTAQHIEFDPVVILKKEDVRVGPYRAIQYETAQPAAPSISIETYFQVDGGGIVRIVTGNIDAHSVTEQMRQLHSQILSTFRFTPPAP